MHRGGLVRIDRTYYPKEEAYKYHFYFTEYQKDIHITNKASNSKIQVSCDDRHARRFKIGQERIKLCLCTIEEKELIDNIAQELEIIFVIKGDEQIFLSANGTDHMGYHLSIIKRGIVPSLVDICALSISDKQKEEVPVTIRELLSTRNVVLQIEVVIDITKKGTFDIDNLCPLIIPTCIHECKCKFKNYTFPNKARDYMRRCVCQKDRSEVIDR
jgi:hypothetical protein